MSRGTCPLASLSLFPQNPSLEITCLFCYIFPEPHGQSAGEISQINCQIHLRPNRLVSTGRNVKKQMNESSAAVSPTTGTAPATLTQTPAPPGESGLSTGLQPAPSTKKTRKKAVVWTDYNAHKSPRSQGARKPVFSPLPVVSDRKLPKKKNNQILHALALWEQIKNANE